MTKPILSSRLDNTNAVHARITVFNRGANAGVLTVNSEDAGQVMRIINSYADLLGALKAIRTQLGEMNVLCWEESKLRLIVFTGAAIAKAEKPE